MSATYLNSRAVRQRYGNTSEMSLWRWRHDDKLTFPKPTIINKRLYWRVDELEAWERARAASA
jgi:predicted DNA-binding transcriptional regulator AlpA